MAALKEGYEKSLNANAATQKDLQENLITAKHELLRVQEQLTLAEKVCFCDNPFLFLRIHSNQRLKLTPTECQVLLPIVPTGLLR